MFIYRLRFCADELSERREKRSAANALGLGADVDEDLAAGCAAIERKYLEAEEGMNAVPPRARRCDGKLERSPPEAFVRSGEPTVLVRTVLARTVGRYGRFGRRGFESPPGALLDVFAEASNSATRFTR